MNQDELLTERQNERESVKQTYRYTGRQKDEKTNRWKDPHSWDYCSPPGQVRACQKKQKDRKTKDKKTKRQTAGKIHTAGTIALRLASLDLV